MDYSEEVIDHAKNPRNFGVLRNATLVGKESNATCGDMVEVYIKVKRQKARSESKEKILRQSRASQRSRLAQDDMVDLKSLSAISSKEEMVIEEVRWRGVGCAMSTAMASMLTEKIVGMSLDEVEKLDEKIVEELMGEVNPGRMKCVMLPVVAVRRALE